MLGWLSLLPLRIAQRISSDPELAQLLAGQSPWGLASIVAARRTLGWAERGANNRGPQIERLRRTEGGRGSWCAAAVSYWIEDGWALIHGAESWGELGPGLRAACPFRRSHGAKALGRHVARIGALVRAEDALPGDVLVWDRSVPGRPETAWQGHTGLQVAGVGRWAIEGNVGAYPAQVAERDVTDRGRLLMVARLPRAGR